jgi:hypothetical protein
VKFFLHVPAWLGAAQLPLQAAVLAYVGAGGLAGAAVVGGVMLSPVGEVVQEAVAPARQFVESVVPMGVPSIFPTDPRRAVAQLPVGKAQAPKVAAPTAVATPMAVDDLVPQEDVAEAAATPQTLVIAPQRSAPAAQLAVQPAPEAGNVAPLEMGQPPLAPSVADRPVAVIYTAPVMPGRPAAAVAEAVRTGSRSELGTDAQARATSVSSSPRVAIGNANSDNLRAASVAPPTTIVVRTASGRTSELSPTSTAVPTPRPTTAPAAAAPTLIPTAASERAEEPTQAPTAVPPTQAPTRVPTQAPTQEAKKTAAPTQEPKKTAVPTGEPTKAPQRPVKATSAPTRAAPAAMPVKEKEKRPPPTPARRDQNGRDQNDHGGHNGDSHNGDSHNGDAPASGEHNGD